MLSSETFEKLLNLAERINHAEADIAWVMQHGVEEGKTFNQIQKEIDDSQKIRTNLRGNFLAIVEKEIQNAVEKATIQANDENKH